MYILDESFYTPANFSLSNPNTLSLFAFHLVTGHASLQLLYVRAKDH